MYNLAKISKWLYRSSFLCLLLTGASLLSSLYNLAADKLSLSYISVLYHCQLKEREAFRSICDTVSPCQAQPLPLLPSLGADEFGRLPHSAPARLIKNPPVSPGPEGRSCHNC